MSVPKGFISWVLVVILSSIIALQYRGATKAEQRAAQAEATAQDLEKQLHEFAQVSAQREAVAQARYESSMTESAKMRAILAKGSQTKPQNAPQSSQEAIRQALDSSKAPMPSQPAPTPTSPCDEFIYQGSPLVIEGFQVLVCDQKPMVQAEAAVAYHEEKAAVDKMTVDLSEATAKLALEDKDLAAYKDAEAKYKKAAKKSRIKQVLGVAEKVGLFAAGVYLGHKF